MTQPAITYPYLIAVTTRCGQRLIYAHHAADIAAAFAWASARWPQARCIACAPWWRSSAWIDG